MAQENQHIIIIGGGLAGIFCALKLSPLPVTILTDAPLGKGASSAWAQGGIAAALSEGDDWHDHLKDTLNAGKGLVNKKMARLMVKEARARIEDLLSYGVPFDKDLQGKLTFGREAAHSTRRIVHVKGDQAGKAIMHALITTAQQTPSIQIIENICVESLITEKNTLKGVIARPQQGYASETIQLYASKIIMTTGGIGGLYATTTNPSQAVGTGLAIAARAGAALSDCEFVQFHPTALRCQLSPAPLLTEALRGEGARLINNEGQRIMEGVHPDLELAPRDLVAATIHRSLAAKKGAYLDTRQAIGIKIKDKFPTVYKSCIEAGFDPIKEAIPIAPATHYHMGGIVTDAHGRTTLNGLWAAGEVAATGVHGANRLASNSLLEAAVFSARIAQDIKNITQTARQVEKPENLSHFDESAHRPDEEAMQTLRLIMSKNLGIERNKDDILKAIWHIEKLEQQAFTTAFRNAAISALILCTSALIREESRGGHRRSDFPSPKESFQKSHYLTLKEIRHLIEKYKKE